MVDVARVIVDERYVVRREIARGGMCNVYVAHHAVTGASVALKKLREGSRDLAIAEARLMREARILGSLRHPGVVAIFDAGVCDTHGPWGIVHRDIKPANVLISTTPTGDHVELIDFGIARLTNNDELPAESALTRAGELLGTIAYMAPEQLLDTAPSNVVA